VQSTPPGISEPLRDVTNTAKYMHLADLKFHIGADKQLLALYNNPYEQASSFRESKLERFDHNQSQVILLGSLSWLP